MADDDRKLLALYSVLRDQLEAQVERSLEMAAEIAGWVEDGNKLRAEMRQWQLAGTNLGKAVANMGEKIKGSQREIYETLKQRIGPDDAPDWETFREE